MAVVVDILAEQIDMIVVATLLKARRGLVKQLEGNKDYWSPKFIGEVEATLEALLDAVDYFSPWDYSYGSRGTPVHLSQGLCERIAIAELETGIELNKKPRKDEGGEPLDVDLELINSLEISRAYILSAN